MANRELAEFHPALGGLLMYKADQLAPEFALLTLSARMNNENGAECGC